jgi:hypothetical protein
MCCTVMRKVLVSALTTPHGQVSKCASLSRVRWQSARMRRVSNIQRRTLAVNFCLIVPIAFKVSDLQSAVFSTLGTATSAGTRRQLAAEPEGLVLCSG